MKTNEHFIAAEFQELGQNNHNIFHNSQTLIYD